MINKIVDGIVKAINEKFATCDVYTESVEQGLTAPCFLINTLSNSNDLFLNKRYLRTHAFVIQYFPKTSDVNFECSNVIDELYDALEYIDVDGDLTRASKMGAEVVDNVLNFSVNYDFFVNRKGADETKMEDIESKVDANRGDK